MEAPQRAHTRRQQQARARMFRASHLDWLPGFPIAVVDGGVQWMTAPRGRRHAHKIKRLARHDLRRATYGWSKLVHHFPTALGDRENDAKAWRDGVPFLLELLKGTIHNNRPLPAELLSHYSSHLRGAVIRARQLGRSPDLRPLIGAMSWVHFLAPERFVAAINWLEPRADAIARVRATLTGTAGISVCLKLCELAEPRHGAELDGLIELLADENTRVLHQDGAAAVYDAWCRQMPRKGAWSPTFEMPQGNAGELTNHLIGLLDWIRACPPKTRDRALRLLPIVRISETLKQLHRWWAELRPLEVETQRLFRQPASPNRRKDAARLKKRLRNVVATAPIGPDFPRLIQAVKTIATSKIPGLATALPKVVAQLPEEVRSRLFVDLADISADSPHKIVPFLKAAARFSRSEPPGWHRPWVSKDRAFPLSTVFEHAAHRATEFFTAFSCCRRHLERELSRDDVDCIATLFAGDNSVDDVVDRFLRIARTDLNAAALSIREIRFADRVSCRGERFVKVVSRVRLIDYDEMERVGELHDCLRAAGWEGVCQDMIAICRFGELNRLATLRHAVKSLASIVEPPKRPSPAPIPEWTERFPKDSRATLALLASVDENAETAADRIFQADLPRPDKLARECAALAAKIAAGDESEGLAKRLAKLKRRLQNPPTISPGRLQNLTAKLQNRVHACVLAKWREGFQDVLKDFASNSIGKTTVPNWLTTPTNLSLLASMLELRPAFRELGLRLLQIRCGPQPWTLNDEPANRAFIERMQRRGINTDPWTTPAAPQRMLTDDGRALSLGFEEDPIEILNMGRYFNTCLSPDSFNFFSAISNAVDANKKVAFARDKAGRVLGRCLLALTDCGSLLTFAPYAHDSSLGFGKVVSRFAARLARAMGTVHVTEGQVERLVAPAWYDDGAVDLCGQFPFLKRASAFRASLKSLTPKQFLAGLQQRFAPLELNHLTLPAVLELDELEQNPQLVAPLLPLLGELHLFADHVLMRAAMLANRIGEHEFVHRVLKERGIRLQLRRHREGWPLDDWVLETLTNREPTAALRLLRKTRKKAIRTDEEEFDPHRREWLAHVHHQLGRTQLARRLAPANSEHQQRRCSAADRA